MIKQWIGQAERRTVLTWMQAGLVAGYSSYFLGGIGLWGIGPATATPSLNPPSEAVLNPELQIGIVQRFGEKPGDRLNLQASPGDRLTLTFKQGDRPQTFSVQSVEVTVARQPLNPPQVQERVVLSIHRSFESAETTANQWQAQGIGVEIAQPKQWQVWGQRDRYNTPQARRQLLQDLHNKGLTTAYLQQQTLTQTPQLSWRINGQRYQGNSLQIKSNNNLIQVNERRYAGRLRLQPNAYGTYTLVNQVPVEIYLRGVVPYEIGASAPIAAIEAQAILARTYALRNLRRFSIDNYELCADTQCQVYRGLSESFPRVDAAIATTAGQVLTYGSELIDALYSSTTGGVTAAFEDVWEGEARPYLRPVVDTTAPQVWDLQRRPLTEENNLRDFLQLRQGFNEETWRLFRWQQFGALTELNRDLRDFLTQKQSPLKNFQTIQGLQVLERAQSGRVQKLQVSTDRGDVILTKDEILRCFYAPNSLLFYLQPRRAQNGTLEGYEFIGGGFGHGVGLSQTGSYHLADLGWSAGRILNFYYPNTKLQPLHSRLIFWQDPRALAARAETQLDRPQWTLFGWPIFNWSLFGFKF